jgi:hypothetical protein
MEGALRGDTDMSWQTFGEPLRTVLTSEGMDTVLYGPHGGTGEVQEYWKLQFAVPRFPNKS